jgi:CheY-like chemotaxis protein
MLSGLGQKGMLQGRQPGVGVRFDSLAQLGHLFFEYPWTGNWNGGACVQYCSVSNSSVPYTYHSRNLRKQETSGERGRMPHTNVLMVGRDAALVEMRGRVLRAAGYSVMASARPEQAINQFLVGDFDLVILCHSIPTEERKSLCNRFRQHTSRTPIVSVASNAGDQDPFVDATIESEPTELIAELGDLLSGNGVHHLSVSQSLTDRSCREK